MTRKNLIPLIIVPAMFLMLFSCSGRSGRTNQNTPPDMHTAEIALDWQGSYSGVLPCADCPGIDTELKLDSDRTYRLISVYLEEGRQPDTLTGNFSLEGNLLTLGNLVSGDTPGKYKVEENRLKHLDQDGQEITGDLAAQYILKKNGNPTVEDKRWQLTELYGKPVAGSPQTHYLIFHSKDGRAEAKADCNILHFGYKIRNEIQVRLEQGATTRMACPGQLEQDFIQALMETDNLASDGQTLSLNKARMAPLARFILVEGAPEHSGE